MKQYRYLRIRSLIPAALLAVLFVFCLDVYAADPVTLRTLTRFPITQWQGCYTESGFFHLDHTSDKSQPSAIINYAWNGKQRWKITLPPAPIPYVVGQNVAISSNGHLFTALQRDGQHVRLCTWQDGVKSSEIKLSDNLGWPDTQVGRPNWMVLQNNGHTVIVSADLIREQANVRIAIRVIVVDGKRVITSQRYTSPVTIFNQSYYAGIIPDGTAITISSTTSKHTSFEYLTLATDKGKVKLTQRFYADMKSQLIYIYQHFAVTWPDASIYNGYQQVKAGQGDWTTLSRNNATNYPVCLLSKFNADILRTIHFPDLATWEMPVPKGWESASASQNGRYIAVLNPVSGQPAKRKICIYERPGTLRASITVPVKELRKSPIPSYPARAGIELTLSPDGHTVIAVEQPGKAKGEVVLYTW